MAASTAPEHPPSPSRRLIAAGVKRGTGPLAVQVLSPADRAAHEAASYVRPARLDAPADSLRHERDLISDVVANGQVRAEIAEGMTVWAGRIDAELARRDAA